MENILTGQRGTQPTPVATIPMPASSSATTTAAPVSVVESSVSPSTPITVPRRTPSKQSRVMAKTFAQSAYDKLGYTIACLAGLVLAIGLWIAGAILPYKRCDQLPRLIPPPGGGHCHSLLPPLSCGSCQNAESRLPVSLFSSSSSRWIF